MFFLCKIRIFYIGIREAINRCLNTDCRDLYCRIFCRFLLDIGYSVYRFHFAGSSRRDRHNCLFRTCFWLNCYKFYKFLGHFGRKIDKKDYNFHSLYRIGIILICIVCNGPRGCIVNRFHYIAINSLRDPCYRYHI